MGDLLTFRRMLTTLIVQILFWAGLIASVVIGVILIIYGIDGLAETGVDVDGLLQITGDGGLTELLLGILFLTAGPILVRIVCELLILFFRMNESLTDIRNALREMPELVERLEPVREREVAAAQPTQPMPVIVTTGNGGSDAEERIVAVRAEMNERFSDLRHELRETLAGIRLALTEEGRRNDRQHG